MSLLLTPVRQAQRASKQRNVSSWQAREYVQNEKNRVALTESLADKDVISTGGRSWLGMGTAA